MTKEQIPWGLTGKKPKAWITARNPRTKESTSAETPELKEQEPTTPLLRLLKANPGLVNGHTHGKLLGQGTKGVIMVPENDEHHPHLITVGKTKTT